MHPLTGTCYDRFTVVTEGWIIINMAFFTLEGVNLAVGASHKTFYVQKILIFNICHSYTKSCYKKICCGIHAYSLFGRNVYLRTQRFGVTVVSSYDPGIAHVLHVSPSLHSTHPLRQAKISVRIV